MWFEGKQREHEPGDQELLQSGFRYALSLTHHRHDAEDLTQQAYLNLARSYGRVRTRSLLFRAIRNLFYDRYRRGKVVVFEPLDEQDVPVAGGSDEESTGVQGDLDVLLACLRSVEREALYLNCVEGHTAAEIAELTGQPRGTILSLLARAKQKLRRVAKDDARQRRPES